MPTRDNNQTVAAAKPGQPRTRKCPRPPPSLILFSLEAPSSNHSGQPAKSSAKSSTNSQAPFEKKSSMRSSKNSSKNSDDKKQPAAARKNKNPIPTAPAALENSP